MYDLNNVVKDFPWTKVTYNAVEPWRDEGTNWFDELPEGWGDVCYKYLSKINALLEEYNAKDEIFIEQVKEKWGGLRFYYCFKPIPLAEEKKIEELDEKIYKITVEWEEETYSICCYCGTHKDVHIYGGWVHYACADCERRAIQERENKYREWLMTEEGQEYLHRKEAKKNDMS